MKAIITLTSSIESIDFINNIDFKTLRNHLDLAKESSYLEITLQGNFYVSLTKITLWFENEETLLFGVPVSIIKSFVVKEKK